MSSSRAFFTQSVRSVSARSHLLSRINLRIGRFDRVVKVLLVAGVVLVSLIAPMSSGANDAQKQYVPVQFIAALGDPGANSGTGAEAWGLWRSDPGKTGVWLSMFPILQAAGGYAPGNWRFDPDEWWVDENGLLMTKPDFPLPAGQYLVTGEREVTTLLTVHARDDNGKQRWELEDDASLYDVTHLACRSARYTKSAQEQACSPANVDRSVFRIAPDSPMPDVQGCAKQEYQVLIVLDVLSES